MSNPGMMLTNGGKNLLAKGLLGKKIHFSKVAYGAGRFDYDTESVLELTALKDLRLNLPIVGKQIEGDGVVTILAQLNNFSLAQGFAAREIGVYAIDPDDGKEILYAYRNAGDEYNFIPANTGPVQKNTTFGYRVEIQDAPDVTCSVDFSFAYVSQADFAAHLRSHHSHVGLNKVYRLQDFIQAKMELGLAEPNMMFLENFCPPSVLDQAETQVIFCAKDTSLVGVDSVENFKIGAEYLLTDGEKSEQIVLVGIDASNLRLSLLTPLAQDYTLADAKIIRTQATFGVKKIPLVLPDFSEYPYNLMPPQVPFQVPVELEQEEYIPCVTPKDGVLKIYTCNIDSGNNLKTAFVLVKHSNPEAMFHVKLSLRGADETAAENWREMEKEWTLTADNFDDNCYMSRFVYRRDDDEDDNPEDQLTGAAIKIESESEVEVYKFAAAFSVD